MLPSSPWVLIPLLLQLCPPRLLAVDLRPLLRLLLQTQLAFVTYRSLLQGHYCGCQAPSHTHCHAADCHSQGIAQLEQPVTLPKMQTGGVSCVLSVLS